ncbi:Uu.00g026070.m01.CDS01 [Anthostomella pinea]|uniref:Uu.00g026070.m01.CDS01 n=1 Tax=Anthostomella pinea TaxID=933095 RepID=A0AAI8YA58_9PEZI|nr:Uu.00g026070.m01.CDS01 [Anthostomella pinea]
MASLLPIQNGPSPGREIWLDGLRGFAAAIVAWFHFTNFGLKMPYRSFWDEPAEQNRHLIQLAPFRIIFAGQAMVDIFFVVSGYSVSVGLIRLRNRGSTADFYRKLTSAVFRRLFRLFFPVLIISIISHTLYYLGFYAWLFTAENGFPGCVPYSNPWPHVKWLLRAMFNIVNLQSNQNRTLNDHLWTIPVEMRGSMFVYLAIVAFASVRANLRPFLTGFLGLRFLWTGSPEFAAFFAGLTLAELDGTTESLTLPHLVTMEKAMAQTTAKLQRFRNPAKWALFAMGVYFLCLPVQEPFPADWFFQTYINPPFWTEWETRMRSWQTIGAVLFIGTARKTPILKRPFETRFAQFLGEISFSLYLLHQTIYRIALNRILDWVSWVFLGQGYWAAEKEENNAGHVVFFAWTVATLVIGSFLAVASKYMAKTVDKRSVALAHRVEKLCSP